ncbi:hypothetical protein [[Ruminococcus] torques]
MIAVAGYLNYFGKNIS